MIMNSLIDIIIGLVLGYCICKEEEIRSNIELDELGNSFLSKACGVGVIYVVAGTVKKSIDDIFISGKGSAYIVIEMAYSIVGFIVLFAILDCIKMIRFIRGTWVPKAIKEKVVKVIWGDTFTVTKLICIEDAEIRKWLKENVELPLMKIERADLRIIYCYNELRKAYRSFTPEIKAIYQDLVEWEKLYEKAAHKDWNEEKTSYLKEVFYKKSDMLLKKIDAMEQTVTKIVDMEKQHEKHDREAFKEKVDAEVFRNIT